MNKLTLIFLMATLGLGGAGVYFAPKYKDAVDGLEETTKYAQKLKAENAKLLEENEALRSSKEALSNLLTDKGIETAMIKSDIGRETQSRDAALQACQERVASLSFMAERAMKYDECLVDSTRLKDRITTLEEDLKSRSTGTVKIQIPAKSDHPVQEPKPLPEAKLMAPEQNATRRVATPTPIVRAPQDTKQIDHIPRNVRPLKLPKAPTEPQAPTNATEQQPSG